MKKIFYALLLILIIASQAWAVIYIQTVSSGAAYMFRYNADHASGDTYAYTSSGSGSSQGTLNSTTTSTAQNHTSGGSRSLAVSGVNDRITWNSGVSGFINTAEGSLELWLYCDAASVTSGVSLFEISVSGGEATNIIRALMNSSRNIYFRHEGNNQVVSLTTTNSVTLQTWTRIRFRWSVTNNLIGVQIGTDSWENDADSTPVNGFSVTETYLLIGDGAYNSETMGYNSYIDDYEVIDGYDTFND